MDLLCLMFESGERGVLASSGLPWTDEEIIHAVGGDAIGTAHELAELVRKGVLSRRKSDSALFSRRLVREETLRKVRSEAGKLGGRPAKYSKTKEVTSKSKTKAKAKQNTEYEIEIEVNKNTTRSEKRSRARARSELPAAHPDTIAMVLEEGRKVVPATNPKGFWDQKFKEFLGIDAAAARRILGVEQWRKILKSTT